jgi:hypothetical protein
MRMFLGLGCVVLALSLIAAPDAVSNQGTAPTLRQREGTKIVGLNGEVREAGRRWIFVTPQGMTYNLLENLALQRAVQAARDDPEDRNWTIDGEFTEFLNENYILTKRLSRTVRSQTSPKP